MNTKLVLYNTLNKKKEELKPLNPPNVGLYVCGPTVYGEAHLGHARPTITFDVLFRYLTHLGYKVRYVRNITDVGHLENDADEGEDKIAKKAKLDNIEPMEVVQFYTESFHESMRKLNVKPPSIEPRASGHIIEQQELIQQIIDNGFAYESEGSVYFDVEKYNKSNKYGILSGRNIEDMLSNTRELAGQTEKKGNLDFALWKKAKPEHIMRWKSPWSEGFPGWHLECSAMSTKYLGEEFDIHGGGMDLMFPHHECEIAQSVAAQGKEAAKMWVHNNMITINGQKMGKSLGNFITLNELFTGTHELLEKEYSPMTIRFFILQAHYRSTLDFSNSALQASEKGLHRLMEGINNLNKINTSSTSSFDVDNLMQKCYDAINDDLNTPILISHLFEGVKFINSVKAETEKISQEDLEKIKIIFNTFTFEVLGLKNDTVKKDISNDIIHNLLSIIIDQRTLARKNKDFATADKIRDDLKLAGITIKDTKDGFEWDIEK
jgi:cysteinyl-tRNA synthetase